MALPVAVTLDRGDQSPLDLSPLIAPSSLTWSSVVPGGFASCSFQMNGDFRQLVKQIPYLSIVRVMGDSGRVLFEGQIEDLAPMLSDTTVGIRVGAYGLQNALREQTVRQSWSKRDMQWRDGSAIPGSVVGAIITMDNSNFSVALGNFDPTSLSKSGAQITANGGVSVPATNGHVVEWLFPSGFAPTGSWLGTYAAAGTDSATTKWELAWFALQGGTWSLLTKLNSPVGPTTFNQSLSSATSGLRLGVYNFSGAAATLAAGDVAQWYDMRVLGTSVAEDVAGGFNGGTLINSLLGFVPALGAGVIETGSDFTIDHLDASVRRSAYEILQEIASYYTREWAVWENSLLHWRTPQLSQPQWIIPLTALTALDLDASTDNSKKSSIVLYTDAASGLVAEATATSVDRRNPYVLKARAKDAIADSGLPMTSGTASQLATALLNDLGFGPVPAAGTISLPGETIVQHASGSAQKAWEIRAGDNVTIPELPMADVFTQDGRGENLFHVISSEAQADTGTVTLSLDSYGSRRSDVLLARLSAVTKALGG